MPVLLIRAREQLCRQNAALAKGDDSRRLGKLGRYTREPIRRIYRSLERTGHFFQIGSDGFVILP